jgi:hypothetical protein
MKQKRVMCTVALQMLWQDLNSAHYSGHDGLNSKTLGLLQFKAMGGLATSSLCISAGGLIFIGSTFHEIVFCMQPQKDSACIFIPTSIDVRCVIISRIVPIAFQPVL